MTEQIKQEFIFEATKALATLTAISKAYENFNSVLRAHAKAARDINTSTTKINNSLGSIKSNAEATAIALGKVYAAQGTAARAPAARAAGRTTAAPIVDPGKVRAAAASMQELTAAAAKMFSGVTVTNQKAFERGINNLATSFHRSGGSLKEFKNNLKLLDSTMNSTKAKMRASMKQIQGSVQSALSDRPLANFVISWQTMVRIISTQLIVRAINLIRTVLIQSFKSAVEFGRAIAEVGTIANGAYGDLQNIAKIVRETSDEFGKGRKDVAEGLYQTLSNQVGTAAESLKVFKVANKLSIAAVGSTADAVNLLTAALNGFDISVSRADDVAGKLFRTVELGRTRMSELANTLGRVGPLANALGISLEETLAGIATITVQGTKSAEALTQLRGVMQAMLKPSEEMKKVFKEMGIASAEAGIAAFGFQGFLLEMTKVTGNSASEMGKLIRRVRGLLGAITIGSSDTEKFVENLEAIQDTSAQLLQEKFKLVFETPGEEVLREFNKLKNIFVVDLGPALITTTLNVVNFVKALSDVSPFLIKIGTLLATFVIVRMVALKVIQSQLLLTQIALNKAMIFGWIASIKKVKTLNRAMLVLKATTVSTTLVIGTIVAALVIFAYSVEQINRSLENKINLLVEAKEKQIDYNKSLKSKEAENRLKLEQQLTKVYQQSTLQVLAAAQKAFNERNALVKEANDKELSATSTKFESLSKLLENYVSEYLKKYKELKQSQEQSVERAANVSKQADTDQFERNIRFLSDQKKLNAQRARALKLQQQAKGLVATGDPDQVKRGLALYKEATALIDTIQSVATDQLAPLEALNRVGKLTTEQRTQLLKARKADNAAGRLGVNLVNSQLKAEKALQQIVEKRAKQVKERAEAQRKLNAQIKIQFDTILANSSTVTKEGQLLDKKTLAKQTAARARAFAEVRSLASQSLAGLDIADQLQLTTLSLELNKALSPASLSFSEDVLNNLSDQIALAISRGFETAAEKLAVTLGPKLIPGFTGEEGFAELQKGYLDLTTNTLPALQEAQEKITQNLLEQNAAQAKSINLFKAAKVVGSRVSEANIDQARDIYADVKLLRDPAIEETAVGLSLLQEQIVAIKSNRLFEFNGEFKTFVNLLEKYLAQRARLLQLRTDATDLSTDFDAAGGQSALQNQLNLVQAAAVQKDGALQFATTLHTAEGQLSTQATTNQNAENERLEKQRRLYDDILRIRESINEVGTTSKAQVDASAASSLLRGVQRQSKGGLIRQMSYFAKGNLARGTDTIPAMLTPGEFVMNAKSTRRFYSQLVAMNSGRSPIYREAGGSVTNISVGDVKVQGGKDPAQTGRHIVGAIKRELRRGTSSF